MLKTPPQNPTNDDLKAIARYILQTSYDDGIGDVTLERSLAGFAGQFVDRSDPKKVFQYEITRSSGGWGISFSPISGVEDNTEDFTECSTTLPIWNPPPFDFAEEADYDEPADILAQIAFEQTGPIFQDWLDTLELHLFDGAESLEDVRDRVESAYPRLDAASFAATMQQVMLLGYGTGRYEVLEEVGEAVGVRDPHALVRREGEEETEFEEEKPIPIKEPELLAAVRRLLSKYYTDGIDAISSAYVDEDDNIKGVFLDYINSRITKQLAFKITDSDISYRLLNPGLIESANFSEEDFLDFASPKQCKKGIACGMSCISASKTCKKQITPAQTGVKQAVVSRAKGKKAATTNTTVAATPTPKTKANVSKKTAIPSPTSTTSATPPVSQPKSPIKTNSTELDKSRGDLVSRFGQKTVDDAEANVQRILNDADTNVYIRVGSSDTLEKVLGDRFKTSAELGIDTHQIPHLKDGYQSARNRVEAKTLGYDEKNTLPEDRPIYGYLGGKDLNGSSHADVSAAYGSIAVKLRSEVKERSTFTSADSFKSGIASEVINAGSPPPPNAASLVSTTRHGYDRDNLPSHYPSYYKSSVDDKPQLQAAAKAKTIDDLALVGATTGNRYMEAQIHGTVTGNDIGEIHFSPRGVGDRPNAAIAQYAKDNGIDLYVNGKKVDPDDIINPKTKRTKLNDLSDAIDKGDFDTVIKIADDINTKAEKLQLAPGEVDRYLKQLFIDSKYDGLPKVAAKDDITKIWQDGGTLMVRGMDAGPNGKTQFFDQFKSGDYFTGNGIYGNGTYVSAANGSTAKDAKDSLSILRKLAYSKASGATMRMALPSDANVIDAKALTAEMRDFKNKFDKWTSDEEQKIYAGATSGSNFKKTVDKYKKDYNPKGATVNVLHRGGAGREVIRVDIPFASNTGGANRSIPVQMTRNALDDYTVSIGGVTKKVKGLDKATKAAVEMVAETRAKSDLMSDPTLQQKINDHARRVQLTKEVLFGDEAGGTSGRFATVRGYDAVKLSNSYEPDNFMILLNRSKVLVQDTELNYKTALKDVAG